MPAARFEPARPDAAKGDVFGAYLPRDRRCALAAGESLPERSQGCALFADISGFTSLTATLTNTLGLRRGAEELPHHLNGVYDVLMARVQAFGGSVIGFSGDAVTCWFDGDDGLCASACALAMQAAMEPFAHISLANGQSVTLAVKVAVASGPVRRFVVGDPEIQLLDVLAGETLTRLSAAEGCARPGEVVLDKRTAARLEPLIKVAGWRAGGRVAVVRDVIAETTPVLLPAPVEDETQLRPWLLPAVYARLQAGQGEFLTELRPVTALFLRFTGLDYDGDEAAGEKLNAFVRWVQAEASRLGGALLQLTVGDKGSYLYLAFGAPVAHEDDAGRAVAAASSLRAPPAELVSSVHIGLSQGIMRVGAYGGVTRRTYGALGDATNVAARLMGEAASGQVLATEALHRTTSRTFWWRALAPVKVKGKVNPIAVFELAGASSERPLHLQEPATSLPMIGRRAELACIEEKLEQAQAGCGQIVGITAEAGMGKSRLVAATLRLAQAAGGNCFGGECQSSGIATPYLAWQPIFRGFFGLDLESSQEVQLEQVASELRRVSPDLLPRLPLLASVLNLTIPDNALTASLDGELRKTSREALLVDLLRARAREGGALLLALEDVHWLDPLSRDLLTALSRAITEVPVLLLLSYRPAEATRPETQQLAALAHFSELELQALTPEEAEKLIEAKLAHPRGPPLSSDLRRQLLERAEGNPFYLEELLNYLFDQFDQGAGADPSSLTEVEWPANLHSLILSRVDRLTEAQKVTLKVASVIGRVFRVAWLHGYYPPLGEKELEAELEELRRLDFTPLDTPEPLAYLFKHIIIRDVAYESLPYRSRAALHEELARFIETIASAAEPFLDLLAFHYERGENLTKKREYLRRAGESAQASFANETAIAYYQRLLPLLEPGERTDVLLKLGEVQALLGRYSEARASYQRALDKADEHTGVRARRLMGELLEKQGDYAEALTWLEEAQAACRALGDWRELVRVLLAMGGNVYWQQGAYATAQAHLGEALTLTRELGEVRGTARALHGLGNVQLYRGNTKAARKLFAESLALRRGIGDKLGVANALNNLGIIAANDGDAETARKLFEESLAMRRTIGDKSGVAVALNNLGFMASERGEVAAAQTFYEESLALRRELGDKLGMAVSLNNLGNLARARGDEAAAQFYRESLIVTRDIGCTREAAAALTGLAAVTIQVASARPGGADYGRAVRLAAAADALLATIGAVMEPEVRALRESALAAARARLDGTSLAAAWNEGRAMSLEQAAAYALAGAPRGEVL